MVRSVASNNSSLQTVLRRRRVPILAGILLLGLLYIAVPQMGFFHANWDTLLRADRAYLLVSLCFLLTSFAAAAGIYTVLLPGKLQFQQTYLVQIAGAFAGKVLPAGLGSIGVSFLYLRRKGLNKATAATVVGVNNLVGVAGHVIWLVILGLLFTAQLQNLSIEHLPDPRVAGGIVAAILVLVVLSLKLKRRMQRLLGGIMKQLSSYLRQPTRLLKAVAISMLLTACNIAIVWLSAHAIGASLSIVAAAVALTTGVLGQTATPTPGGLGGVEAGLVAGLVVTGISVETAVSVTILFRFVTFWIPLLFGSLAMVAVIRRKLV